ncbi:hypothetical protein ASE86_12605 [Sphingomonas sp. Leaf33]|uniref:hypothetical protein n=1 Tax=Sphingomonas sp. Leaf33 TaxID=1736215 RepID=UPI0006FBFE49|nr:hypothetical protein [Sphingomonas sp. Leaf33]KQN19603.1 hypothetical protein ASE86_12605 [Sphingomonas sp. Leaf33]
MSEIKQTVDETMTVAPDGDDAGQSGRGDAGRDESIAERLQRNPESKDARLDRALDESMDASDPPATTQPIHNHQPAPSSGFDEEAEKARQRDA